MECDAVMESFLEKKNEMKKNTIDPWELSWTTDRDSLF